MDVFDLRNRLVDDYARYTRRFIKIADPCIKAKVDGALDDGALWPEPLLQLNPTFLPGGTIDDLVDCSDTRGAGDRGLLGWAVLCGPSGVSTGFEGPA